ncbi:DUF1461 domain-containing protein [Candidatus Woesearchaeota archaeon]|nr:DUF1461 domain-containing protein [Candidatus Woesearchaeota archaeon]
MRNKSLSLAVSIAMILLVPAIFYGYALNSTAFDREFYKKEFLQYGVYNDLQDYDVDSINNEVLNYLKMPGNNELMGTDFFDKREKAHLLDVKILIHRTLKIYFISLALFLILAASLAFLLGFAPKIIFQRFLLILLFGCTLSLSAAFLLFAVSKTDFDFAFGLLHKTFFSAGTYTFNPESEKIVVLYPESLFSDAFAKIILKVIFPSAAIFLASLAVMFCFLKENFLEIFTGKFRR